MNVLFNIGESLIFNLLSFRLSSLASAWKYRKPKSNKWSDLILRIRGKAKTNS